MDVWTKIFLLNGLAVLIAFVMITFLPDLRLQKTTVLGWSLGWWFLLTIFSVPVWLVWAIVSN